MLEKIKKKLTYQYEIDDDDTIVSNNKFGSKFKNIENDFFYLLAFDMKFILIFVIMFFLSNIPITSCILLCNLLLYALLRIFSKVDSHIFYYKGIGNIDFSILFNCCISIISFKLLGVFIDNYLIWGLVLPIICQLIGMIISQVLIIYIIAEKNYLELSSDEVEQKPYLVAKEMNYELFHHNIFNNLKALTSTLLSCFLLIIYIIIAVMEGMFILSFVKVFLFEI